MTQADPIDTTIPHSARVWNYWLGRKDNFAVDREAAQMALDLMPELVESARADRAFLGRAVRHLAGPGGVRQFLDIGTGLPTADNTHEVAQSVAPESRIVYVDNDPIVLVHARALLKGSPEGATDYLEADARDPEAILTAAARTLDFDRPIAVMMLGLLEFIPDDAEAYGIVERLMDAVPSGSYLVIAHGTPYSRGNGDREAIRVWRDYGADPLTLRSTEEIERFFDRLELLEPGVVPCSRWRPTGSEDLATAHVSKLGAVGRKP